MLLCAVPYPLWAVAEGGNKIISSRKDLEDQRGVAKEMEIVPQLYVFDKSQLLHSLSGTTDMRLE